MFSNLSLWIAKHLGSSYAFMMAILFVIVWLVSGPIFDFSNTWQLVINTTTTIITFLMVFLLQHTQNRDTMAIQLKLDEVIRSIEGANDELLKIEELSDDDLETILKRYEDLAIDIKKRIRPSLSDTNIPDIKNDSK